MYEPLSWCTLLVIGVTVLFSALAFHNPALERKYIFNPESILAHKEYYRLVTPALLHAGWGHLIWNMVSLYFFAPAIELRAGWAQFLFIYLGSVIGGNLLALFVHRHHQYFAYGASGGVCGIIFAHILLFPGTYIRFFFVPVPIPGWLYAIGFMVFSFFSMKRGLGNIGHDAHLGGAIIGLLIAAGLNPEIVRYNPLVFFLVLGAAVLLLIYLWVNPHLLPGVNFTDLPFRSRQKRSSPPPFTRENLQVDTLLEKIARDGVESLTADEKAYLDEVSGKYRRRAESKKPGSGLSI
jgi:membrane associated rhomboid family serine protease